MNKKKREGEKGKWREDKIEFSFICHLKTADTILED